MVKIWINTKQGLKEITIRKKRNKDTYEIIKEKKKKKTIKRKITKTISKGEIGKRIIKDKLKEEIKEKKQEKKNIKGIKSQKIGSVFEKKTSKLIIEDILNIPTNEINLKYKELFRKVIYDKDLMDIMIQQENINKIKHRFEIRATAYDVDGTIVLEMIKGSGGDLMTLKEKMRKGIWRGASVDYDIDLGDGYIFKIVNKGNINSVKTTIVFRS